jgi:hypothetical protein
MNGDRDIRELLRAKASEMPPSTGIPTGVLKRSKRRRALVASAVSLALVIAGAGAVAGVSALTERPRLDPVRPAPSETDRSDDGGPLEDTMPMEFGVTEMFPVTTGRLPDGKAYVLRVGASSRGWCAELLPEGTGTCSRGSLIPGPLTVYAQGASSENDYQHFYGATYGWVTDIEVRRHGEVVDAVQTQVPPGPAKLGKKYEGRIRFFVAFAPQNTGGTILALDHAGRPSDRVAFDRMAVTRSDCGAGGSGRKARHGGVDSRTPVWAPLPQLEPTGIIASSLAALITSSSGGCSESVQVSMPRKAGKDGP